MYYSDKIKQIDKSPPHTRDLSRECAVAFHLRHIWIRIVEFGKI